MSLVVFVVFLIVSVLTYLLISRYLERKQRAAALGRLHGKTAVTGSARQNAEPVLLDQSDEVRGPLATQLLERLKLKPIAERWLETADLTWGAAGLIHRSIAAFLAGFFLVILVLRRIEPLWGFAGA